MQTSASSPTNVSMSPSLIKYQHNNHSFSNSNNITIVTANNNNNNNSSAKNTPTKSNSQNIPISLISQNAIASNDNKWTNNMISTSRASVSKTSSNMFDENNNHTINHHQDDSLINMSNNDNKIVIRKYSTVSNMPSYFPNNKTLPSGGNNNNNNNENMKKKLSITQYPQPLPQPPPASLQNLKHHNNHNHQHNHHNHNNNSSHYNKHHNNKSINNNNTQNELNNSSDPIVYTILNNNILNTTNATSKNKYLIEYPYKKIKFYEETNIVWNVITLVVSFLFNLMIMIPIAILISLMYPLKHLFRLTFKLMHICHLTNTSHSLPDLVPEFLTPNELFWLYNSNLVKQSNNNNNNNNNEENSSHNNKNKSTGACLFFIEGYLPIAKVKDLITNKIIKASERTDERNFERFIQRIYNLSLYGYVWLNTTNFNIDEHVIEIENNNLNTNEDLQIYISKLMSTHQFKMDKPLWSIYYKKGFGPEKSTVLFFVYHMCFSDGISLIRLFFKGIIDNRMELDLKPRFAYFSFYFDLLKHIFFGWSRIFYHMISTRKDKNPLHSNHYKSNSYVDLNLNSFSNQPLNENASATTSRKKNAQTKVESRESKQIYIWSEPFDLVVINRLKLITRCKLNEFLVSVVAGVIRNYLQVKGINHPRNIKCIMPIDLSSNKYPFKLKQRSTFSSYEMPVNSEGIIPRLWNTRNSIGYLKSSSNYLLIYFYKYFLFNLLPNKMAFSIIKNFINKNTIVASTLGAGDASLATASLCNRNVKNIIYFYPPICDLSISFSIVTYGEEVRMSLVADSNIITHPKLITAEFIRQVINFIISYYTYNFIFKVYLN